MPHSVKGLTEVEKAGRDVMSRVPVSGYLMVNPGELKLSAIALPKTRLMCW